MATGRVETGAVTCCQGARLTAAVKRAEVRRTRFATGLAVAGLILFAPAPNLSPSSAVVLAPAWQVPSAPDLGMEVNPGFIEASMQQMQEPEELPRVLIETEMGEIEVELAARQAPATVANFLRYVDAKRYDGGSFYRTVTLDNQPDDDVRIEVIQADVSGERGERFGQIALERTRDTGLRHVDGTISMARNGPDTATSSFFICIGDQPSLDFGGARNPDGQGFAAFGRVVRGMDVVREIQVSQAEEQRLTPPIRILRISRVEGSPGV